MKTTQAILKSQELLLPKYNKQFGIGGDNLCGKKRKYTKSQFWSYISTLKKKKQVENISPLNATISMAPGILILVEKLENITFGGCQSNSTPTMYILKNMNIWCDFI